jgi:hypothetical protein
LGSADASRACFDALPVEDSRKVCKGEGRLFVLHLRHLLASNFHGVLSFTVTGAFRTIDFGIGLPALAWRFRAVRLRRSYSASFQPSLCASL